MKKILKNIFLILVVALFAAFAVACGKKEELSKKEVIERFIENSKNIKSADMTSNIQMKEIEENNSMNFDISFEASIIIEPFAMRLNAKTPFQKDKMELYIKDGYLYVFNPFNKQWIKQVNTGFDQEYLKNILSESDEVYNILLENIDKIILEEKMETT